MAQPFKVNFVPPPDKPTRTQRIGNQTFYFDAEDRCYAMIADYEVEKLKEGL